MADVRRKQKDAITRMLNLNKDQPDGKGSFQGGWKVLIYDKACQDILSPLMNVDELRKLGITLHMLIDQKRERVPDVPAVYFVRPTSENVEQICRDCASGLYDTFHLNFSSSLPRALLEQLAQANLQSESTARVAQVYDQYCEFVSLQPRLVSLNLKDSYISTNSQRQSDDQIMAYIDSVVDSLFCLVVTMGTVPVIQCPGEGAAEMVASKLCKRLRAHLLSRNNLFAGSAGSSFHRPLLVLLDRNLDLSALLHHTWTYQALCHDVLGMDRNRVNVEQQAEPGRKQRTVTYDLGETDAFWRENAGLPFPKVAEAVEARLQEYQAAVKDVNEKSGRRDDLSFDDGSGTSDLAAAIGVLPELQRRKRVLDTHTNMATAILQHLKSRELDNFFSWEETLMTKGQVDKKELSRLLSPALGKGTTADKLRLLLIYYLCGDVSAADLDALKAEIMPASHSGAAEEQEQQGGGMTDEDLAPLYFLKAHPFLWRKQNNKLGAGPSAPPPSSKSGMLSNFASAVYGQADTLLSGVRNLLPTNTNLPVTKTIDALMTSKECPEVEGFLSLDPKVTQQGSTSRRNRPNAQYQEAFVFVLGGGNYIEHQNLQDYAQNSSAPGQSKSITYATTEIVSPEKFLKQLGSMGQEHIPTK